MPCKPVSTVEFSRAHGQAYAAGRSRKTRPHLPLWQKSESAQNLNVETHSARRSVAAERTASSRCTNRLNLKRVRAKGNPLSPAKSTPLVKNLASPHEKRSEAKTMRELSERRRLGGDHAPARTGRRPGDRYGPPARASSRELHADPVELERGEIFVEARGRRMGLLLMPLCLAHDSICAGVRFARTRTSRRERPAPFHRKRRGRRCGRGMLNRPLWRLSPPPRCKRRGTARHISRTAPLAALVVIEA